jgi:hypothetical protein
MNNTSTVQANSTKKTWVKPKMTPTEIKFLDFMLGTPPTSGPGDN